MNSYLQGILAILILYIFFAHLVNKIYPRASFEILKETREHGEKFIYFLFPMFELIDYKRLVRIKHALEKRDLDEKKLLKAAINSELERLKHFAPMGVVITLLVTAFFSTFINVIPAFSSWNNNIINIAIEQKIKALEKQGVSNDEIAYDLLDDFKLAPDFAELLRNNFDTFFDSMLNTNVELFVFVLVCLGVYWISYQMRLSRLLKLKYLFDEIY